MGSQIRIAACHASPIFLSARETTNKAMTFIKQAANNNANLVVFPESFIPAFPVWSVLRPPTENHHLFKRMALESVYADGEELHDVRSAAKAANIIVSIGISEKVRTSSATLYNSNILVSSEGDILLHHRKLMPTFFEKLTWAPGDGFGLRVAETPFGKIGNLICGENTNPLARYALMSQGEEVHISTWPAVWPTRVLGPKPKPGYVDESQDQSNAEPRQNMAANYDNVAANKIRAAAHCFEAKCFGVLCSGMLGDDAIETISAGSLDAQFVSRALEQSQRGATMFLDPTGALLQGFTVDRTTEKHIPTDFLQGTEDILYADLDLGDCIQGKQYHDVVGGYQRLDVFELRVDRSRRQPVNFVDGDVQRR